MTQETSIWTKLDTSAFGDFVATSGWAFPTIETVHVFALVTVLGAIFIMDLRLLGLASKDTAVTKVAGDTLTITWIGFVIAAITGTMMFIGKANVYIINPYFLAKMGMLVLVGLNMLFFHFVTWKGVNQWDTVADIPTSVKVAGLVSLVFWIVIAFLGRVIGFTLGMYF
jgi:uncharacterized membrane protein